MNGYIKTTILFAGLTALLMVGGYLVGGNLGIVTMLIFSLILNIGTYWFSDKIALRFAHAKLLPREEAPWIYSMTEEITTRINMKTPRLYFSQDIQPNAFATGRNQSNAVICLTKGLIENLNQNEIKAVIAHEIAHIKNNDILISTIASVIAGVISSIGDIFFFNSIFGGDDEGGNPIAIIFFIIIAPIIAIIIQLSISRTREFIADKSASQYTRDPLSLADALQKIEVIAKKYPMNVNPAMTNLYIQNPTILKGIAGLFSTHPPTYKRVEKLIEYSKNL